MMSATSPRGTMPAPMRRPPRELNPQNIDGTMHPTTLEATASAV